MDVVEQCKFALEGNSLSIPERVLIERGYLKTETRKGKFSFDVFHYSYIDGNNRNLKDNWTCDRRFWF